MESSSIHNGMDLNDSNLKYQPQMQVASVNQSNVCHGRGEAYYFGTVTRALVDASGQCETKQCLSWTRRSLLFCYKDMRALAQRL
jgi:hypothetical protein